MALDPEGKCRNTVEMAYLVMCQLLRLRDQHGAANFTLGASEETLVLLDHVFHCGGRKKSCRLTDVISIALSVIYLKHRHQVMESILTHIQLCPWFHCATTHVLLTDLLHYYLFDTGQWSLPSHIVL